MKRKVSDLSGVSLDWAVAKCKDHTWRCPWLLEKEGYAAWQSYEKAWGNPTPEYSTDWAQGGPIIDEYDIDICRHHVNKTVSAIVWSPAMFWQSGPTALVAAMRCYVHSYAVITTKLT